MGKSVGRPSTKNGVTQMTREDHGARLRGGAPRPTPKKMGRAPKGPGTSRLP